jgi:protein tyrosine phosphatase
MSISQVSSQRCYAPANYRPPTYNETCTIINNALSNLIVSKYTPETNTLIQREKKIYDCLHKHNDYRDVLETGATDVSVPTKCARRNRFTGTYSYSGQSLNNLENDNYINSAKFSGKLVEVNGAYVYTESTVSPAIQGFIAATNAPIGDFRNTMKEFSTIDRNKNFEETNVNCGNFDHENKLDREKDSCFSGNSFSNGKFGKDNTQLAFYRALKTNNIAFIVQLTNFAEQPVTGNCLCKTKADRYFNSTLNGEFNISKPDYSPSTAKVQTLTKQEEADLGKNVEIRKLKFTDEDGSTHEVTHYHYRAWQDFSVPTGTDETSLMNLIKKIKTELDAGKNTIVHCTGGIGRTGTFITSVLTSKLKKNVKFNLLDLILKLREKRAEFVETDGQINLIMKNMVATSISGKKLKKK